MALVCARGNKLRQCLFVLISPAWVTSSRDRDQIEAVLGMLRGPGGEIFRPEESPIVSPDPADTKFLRCAQAAYGPTHVVSAGELLDRITLEM
jgi:hypothetical protein